jgi:hypothetical protein
VTGLAPCQELQCLQHFAVASLGCTSDLKPAVPWLGAGAVSTVLPASLFTPAAGKHLLFSCCILLIATRRRHDVRRALESTLFINQPLRSLCPAPGLQRLGLCCCGLSVVPASSRLAVPWAAGAVLMHLFPRAFQCDSGLQGPLSQHFHCSQNRRMVSLVKLFRKHIGALSPLLVRIYYPHHRNHRVHPRLPHQSLLFPRPPPRHHSLHLQRYPH